MNNKILNEIKFLFFVAYLRTLALKLLFLTSRTYNKCKNKQKTKQRVYDLV